MRGAGQAYQTDKVVGFQATGLRPKFMSELETKGIHVPVEIFSPNRALR